MKKRFQRRRLSYLLLLAASCQLTPICMALQGPRRKTREHIKNISQPGLYRPHYCSKLNPRTLVNAYHDVRDLSVTFVTHALDSVSCEFKQCYEIYIHRKGDFFVTIKKSKVEGNVKLHCILIILWYNSMNPC